MLILLRSILRSLTPTAWLIVGVLAAFLLFGAFCSYKGVQAEKYRQAASATKIEAKASTARETAASDRHNDNTTINAREKELSNAVQSLPDAAPSPRRVRLACERLRQQGSRLPAECGPAG